MRSHKTLKNTCRSLVNGGEETVACCLTHKYKKGVKGYQGQIRIHFKKNPVSGTCVGYVYGRANSSSAWAGSITGKNDA